MSQLRSDLALAFQTAVARIQGCTASDRSLLELVRRIINPPMRFVEPNSQIQNAQAYMAERIDALQGLLASTGEAGPSLAKQARRDACDSIEALQAAIFEHGCASATADRVGLGVQGKRI